MELSFSAMTITSDAPLELQPHGDNTGRVNGWVAEIKGVHGKRCVRFHPVDGV